MNTRALAGIVWLCCLTAMLGSACRRVEPKELPNQSSDTNAAQSTEAPVPVVEARGGTRIDTKAPGAHAKEDDATPMKAPSESESRSSQRAAAGSDEIVLVDPRMLGSVIPTALFGAPVAEKEEGTSEGISEQQCSTVSTAVYKVRVPGEFVGPEWAILVFDCGSRTGLTKCCGARLDLPPSESPRDGGGYNRYGKLQIGGRSYTGEQHYRYAPVSRTKYTCELSFYVADRFEVVVKGERVLSDQCPEVASKIDLQALERLPDR